MSVALDILTIAAVSAGAFFFLAGTVGLLRFPDPLTRLHALTKADNLGLGLVVLGLLPQAGSLRDGFKLVCVWLLALLAGATVSQLIAYAARRDGLAPMTIALALEIVLAAVVLSVAVWTIAARDDLRGGRGLRRLRPAARAGVGAPRRPRRGVDGGGDRQRLDRRAAARRGGPPAGRRGRRWLRNVPARRRACWPRCSRRRSRRRSPSRVLFLPDPAPTLAPAAAENAAATSLGNPVTNVLMAFRAMDTMLEKVVVLLALVGVWSLAPDRFWGGRPGPRHQADPQRRARILARLLPPVGIVVGIYLLWVSADHPGGAFQGGTILAAMWLLVMMAGLADAPPVSELRLRAAAVGRPGGLPRRRPRRTRAGRGVPRLSGGVRQAADPGHRVRDDADDRGDARPAGGRPAGTGGRPMSAATVFGLCAAVAAGLGLYGMITNPQPLRKILAFNLLGSGVFLFFGVVAAGARRRASAATRSRRRSSSPGSSSPFRRPPWRSPCCCGCSRRPVRPRLRADAPARRGPRSRGPVMPQARPDRGGDNDRRVPAGARNRGAGGGRAAGLRGRRAPGRTRRAQLTLPLGLVVALAIAGRKLAADGPLVYLLGGWAPPLGVALRADGLSAVMLVITAVVICAIGVFAHADFRTPAGCGEARAPFAFWILLLAIWGALNTVFLAGDLFTLYVALELLTFAAVPLVCLDGRAETLQAALRYLLFALLGSVLYLVGTVLLYGVYGTLDIVLLSRRVHAEPATLVAAALMTVGLLAKTALFPLHLWLPPAHAGAPAGRQRGAFGAGGEGILLHRRSPLVRRDARGARVGRHAAAGGLGAAAIVFGSVMALRQERLKLLIAYSTLAQIGYLFLMFPLAFAPASGQLQSGAALSGGLLQAISHATAKAAMFMVAGMIYATLGHDRVAGLRGIGRALPMGVLAFALGGVALVGVPPSGAYLAKELLLGAAAGTGQWWWAAVIQAGGIFTCGYLVLVLVHALAPAAQPVIRNAVVPWYQQAAALVLALCSLLLGLIHWGAYLPGLEGPLKMPGFLDLILGVLLPLLAGGLLAILLGRFGPGVLHGSILAIVAPARRAALALGAVFEHVDVVLRQWPAAGTSLLALAIALGAAMMMGR